MKFLKWVYIGDEMILKLPLGEPVDPRLLQVAVLDMPVFTVELTYGECPPANPPIPLDPSPANPLTRAIERTFVDMQDCAGNAYTPPAGDAAPFFPHLAAFLSATTVAETAACSHIVGMVVPGLHSIDSSNT